MTGGGKGSDLVCVECGRVFGGQVTYDRHVDRRGGWRCRTGGELRQMDLFLLGGVWRRVVVSKPMLTGFPRRRPGSQSVEDQRRVRETDRRIDALLRRVAQQTPGGLGV